MIQCRIAGVAAAVPSRVVRNDYFHELVGNERAAQRLFGSIGVRERRWAPAGQTALDLCVAASERLLSDGNFERRSIDAIVMVTQSPDFLISPASACVAQSRLGLSRQTLCFDVNQGCTGYIYGLSISKGLVAAGLATRVLLLTGDTLSRLCDPADAGTVLLFGDAGAATLVEASDTPGIQEFYFETDGSGWKVLATPVGGSRWPTLDNYRTSASEDVRGCFRYPTLVNMNGEEVFAFCMQNVPRLVQATLSANELTTEDVTHSVFHQANYMMIEALRRKCGLLKESFLTSIDSFGNTTVASIPVTLCAEAGRLRAGSRCLLAGFGVGLSLAGTVVQIDDRVLFPPIIEV